MKLCSGVCVLSVLVCGLAGAGAFVSAEQAQPEKPAAPAKPGDKPGDRPAMPQVPPEMAAWMEMGKVGAEHDLFKQFEGKWSGKVEMFGDMAGPPSAGVMTNTLVLGGRFLRQEWKGNFMGQPFEGLSYWGFDRAKKKWVSTWMDTMGTGMMISEGDYDAAKKSWLSLAKMTGPDGAEVPSREIVSIVDKDTHVMEMFENQNGKEVMTMKITYTRAK